MAGAKIILSFVTLLFISTFHARIYAHQADQSYLYLSIYQTDVIGRFELNFKELNATLGLSLHKDVTIEELRKVAPQIQQYLRQNVQLVSSLGNHDFDFQDVDIIRQKEGGWVKLFFDLTNDKPQPEEITVEKYDLFFQDFPTHTGMLLIAHHWEAGIVNNEAIPTLVFTGSSRKGTLSLTNVSKWKGWWAMTKLGMWHIWIGLDHILFLLALALPCVVKRTKEADKFVWSPVDRFRSAFWNILIIVTAFTIAHSITLSLAATGIINLPDRIVESIIALSIALAAYHNIRPVFGNREWLIAFAFGLFHGLGFASVLGEKGLNNEFMFLSLFGFNVGVEIGQVAIICIIFPILFWARRKSWYNSFIFYGSIILILISLYWFVERFFEVDFVIDNYIGKAWNKIF